MLPRFKDKTDMMSSSLKSKNILSKHKVESLVSSGAQKAIKEAGQGGEVSRKIPMGNGAGFGERACFCHSHLIPIAQ